LLVFASVLQEFLLDLNVETNLAGAVYCYPLQHLSAQVLVPDQHPQKLRQIRPSLESPRISSAEFWPAALNAIEVLSHLLVRQEA
jgi:hypothetical protein